MHAVQIDGRECRGHQLATVVLWAVTRDDAMIGEHLVGVRQRTAMQRAAHLLLELDARLHLVGMGDKLGYACPLAQYDLADALGLSAVHINRVLRVLREARLMTFQDGRVTFHNYASIVDFAQFDPTYLDHQMPLPPAGREAPPSAKTAPDALEGTSRARPALLAPLTRVRYPA